MASYGTYRSEREKMRALEQRLNRYALDFTDELNHFTDELSALAVTTDYDGDGPFAFSNFAKLRGRLKELKQVLVATLMAKLLSGVRKEWGISEERCSAMASSVLKERYGIPSSTVSAAMRGLTSGIPPSVSRAFQPATPMLRDFEKAARRRWSARVWNLTEQHVREMELAISVALSKGASAQKLSRELKPYLNEPSRLFRRVRDKHGNLVLSKAASEYHPGRGVYRSSHANAMRLARSEINLAYRLAEQYRWQQMGFIVGYEVRVSYARHKPDICDDLAGRYPLTFLWTGWHPHCLCTCVPLFKTLPEFGADTESEYCEDYVATVPKNFTDWVATNSDRLAKSLSRGTLPFFLEDNRQHYTIKPPTP